jgi:hypothetical protein
MAKITHLQEIRLKNGMLIVDVPAIKRQPSFKRLFLFLFRIYK